MTAIGSLMFCNDCGNLLDSSTSKKNLKLKCDVCGAVCKDVSAKTIVTHSKPSDFPSELRAKRSQVQRVREEDVQEFATSRQECEKCGAQEVRYTTMQLRSADEGSTVMYSCPSCGHKWSTNN